MRKEKGGDRTQGLVGGGVQCGLENLAFGLTFATRYPSLAIGPRIGLMPNNILPVHTIVQYNSHVHTHLYHNTRTYTHSYHDTRT